MMENLWLTMVSLTMTAAYAVAGVAFAAKAVGLRRKDDPGLRLPASPRVSVVSRRNPSGDRPPAAALECNRICETEY